MEECDDFANGVNHDGCSAGCRSESATWSQPASRPPPTARTAHAMAYDAARGRVVLFGGSTGVGGNNTWEWDGSQWLEQTSATPPPDPRSGHAMAYDAVRSQIVSFDGGSGLPDDETWTRQYSNGIRETCTIGFDSDGDGRIGCDDPDCWGRCAPACPPGQACDLAAPRCGDGVCNLALESPRLCPQDCGPPTPVCGDFLCDPGEVAATCPGDC